ncbi:MAG TPA: hypothetical protein DIT25_03435 [Candidatus Moranbacteria bacterium]|nr:hypothetical protein [Candidatus Moranbacteria bacterium]
MASQIAHIIYAKKYFEKHPAPLAYQEEFMLGCVFPDIRRIDENIKRKDTHLCFESCDLNFEGLTPFQAGWKFHTYCDMRREDILKKYDFYSIRGTADFWGQAAKGLEDEILYEKYNNWEKLVNYFNNVPEIEISASISRETFQLWYAILAKYIEKKPDSKTAHIFLSKQPSFVDIADDIIQSVDKLRKNEKVIELLEKVSEEII